MSDRFSKSEKPKLSGVDESIQDPRVHEGR